MHMVFGRRAFFGYAARPDGETYWFSNYAQAEEPPRGSFSNVDATRFQRELLLRCIDTIHPKSTGFLQSRDGDRSALTRYTTCRRCPPGAADRSA